MLAFDSSPRDPPRSPLRRDLLTPALVGAATAAEDALARLDARLEAHPLAPALNTRQAFVEAAAALYLEGELVTLEDLVLHDARADIRTPTHELTRAQRLLDGRRRIAAAVPGWASSTEGLDVLRGRVRQDTPSPPPPPPSEDARLAAELAAIDALLKRSARTLAAVSRGQSLEEEPADLWTAAAEDHRHLPPVLAAAATWSAFCATSEGRDEASLALLLTADLLRQRGKTQHHLAFLAIGLRTIPREKRQSKDFGTRLTAFLEGMSAGAALARRELDRLTLLRQTLLRRAGQRRGNSKMGRLIDLVISHPMVTSTMISDALAVTPRAAQNMVQELGLREMTGRLRYRAWGVV